MVPLSCEQAENLVNQTSNVRRANRLPARTYTVSSCHWTEVVRYAKQKSRKADAVARRTLKNFLDAYEVPYGVNRQLAR